MLAGREMRRDSRRRSASKVWERRFGLLFTALYSQVEQSGPQDDTIQALFAGGHVCVIGDEIMVN